MFGKEEESRRGPTTNRTPVLMTVEHEALRLVPLCRTHANSAYRGNIYIYIHYIVPWRILYVCTVVYGGGAVATGDVCFARVGGWLGEEGGHWELRPNIYYTNSKSQGRRRRRKKTLKLSAPSKIIIKVWLRPLEFVKR